MSNKEIIGKLKRTHKFMELHGANEFKIRGYQNAIQRLERVHENLAIKDESELVAIDGLGKSIAGTILEIVDSGNSSTLQRYEQETPVGLLELMQFRGIGIKKLRTLWQDFDITDKTKLQSLVKSGDLLAVKGFGEKTIKNLDAIIEFAFESEGKLHYADAEKIGSAIIDDIKSTFPESQLSFTGRLRRKWEVIESIEILVDIPLTKLSPLLSQITFLEQDKKKSGPFSWKGHTTSVQKIEVVFYPTTSEKFINNLLLKTGSPEHLGFQLGEAKFKDHINSSIWTSEEACYKAAELAYCEPEIREGDWEFGLAASNKLPVLVETSDLQGIIHCHTTYSDGQNTVSEMMQGCRDLGYSYLGITDHSKAASFYANGMFEERVTKQQTEIDSINKEIAPFRIFKGIEADILTDGALDYDNKTLSSFDFVIASIHSGLTMDKLKATERLITAIANPYTTFLGHMTGRILLQRQGYAVDHEAIINACVEYGVIIEINAHPKRLDIDWRYVRMALDKGLILSVNPDSHELAGYSDVYYGVCVGRKGGLTKEQTFNAWSVEDVERYFSERKSKITG